MATHSNRFITSTDYSTLKNELEKVETSLVVPGSTSIPASDLYLDYVDSNIGSKGAQLRVRLKSNATSWILSPGLNFTSTGTVGGSPADYSVLVYMWQPSEGVIRSEIIIHNPYGSTLTTTAGDETFSFYANIFVSPYV